MDSFNPELMFCATKPIIRLRFVELQNVVCSRVILTPVVSPSPSIEGDWGLNLISDSLMVGIEGL